MQIANAISYMDIRYGGPPNAVYKTANELIKLGLNVSSISTVRPGDDLTDCPFPHIEAKTAWPHGWRYAPDFADELRQLASNIDLLHIHEVWQYPQLAASRIAKHKKIPYILSPRGSLKPWSMKRKAWKKQGYLSIFGNNIMKHAACMHAVSDAEADGFRQLNFRGPIAVVPNGISVKEFSQLPDAHIAEEMLPELINRTIILFLSRLSPEKGLDQLLHAWADIVRDNPGDDLLLVLAGPDDRSYRKVLDEIVSSYSLQQHVLFTGMVSGDTKLALMSRASIYVLPSYSEGFSNSLLENLAVGTPALITPGCNFPEAVQAGAAICVEPNHNAIFEGLTTLLNMPERDLFEMGRKGRELVLGSYTWEIAARRLVTVYRSILNNNEIPLHPGPTGFRL